MNIDTAPAPAESTADTSEFDASPVSDDSLAAEILSEAAGDTDSTPAASANTSSAGANTAPIANTTVATADTNANTAVANTATANTTANTAGSDDDFAKVPAKNNRGGENRLPHSQVQRIVERERTNARTAALAELQPRLDEYETERQGFAQFEQAITANPEGVLRLLVQTNPAIAQYLVQPGQSSANTASANNDPMPGPDIELGNGARTYSLEGLQKRDEWLMRQAEARFSARFAPIEQRERAMQAIQQSQREVHSTYADAQQNWPGFKEHETEISAAFAANPRLTHKDLPTVYRKVVFGKLAQGRDTLRAEILKEIQGQPRSTSAPVQTAGQVRDENRPRTDDDLAAEILREAGAGR
jgi:hypothetical protein